MNIVDPWEVVLLVPAVFLNIVQNLVAPGMHWMNIPDTVRGCDVQQLSDGITHS